MRTIKFLAVVGLAVALVAVPALVQGQQQPQATVTINVKCQQNNPVAEPKEAKLKRGETVVWAFDAQLTSCVQGVQSAKITFNNNNHPFQLAQGQQHPFIINLTQRTLGPFTVKSDASPGNYPYKIEFFSQQNAGGNPIQNTTIDGQATVIQVTPTLTEWGLIALAVLLASGMGYMIYRRRPALRPAAP